MIVTELEARNLYCPQAFDQQVRRFEKCRGNLCMAWIVVGTGNKGRCGMVFYKGEINDQVD